MLTIRCSAPQDRSKVKKRARILLRAAALACGVAFTFTASPAEPVGGKFAEPGEPSGELTPFEVRAESDVGYQAANPTSGSRLNSRMISPSSWPGGLRHQTFATFQNQFDPMKIRLGFPNSQSVFPALTLSP